MTSTDRKQIGEILCEKGYLSRPRLKEALEEQKSCKHRVLGRILLDSGYVTVEQLYDALLIQAKYKLPVSD